MEARMQNLLSKKRGNLHPFGSCRSTIHGMSLDILDVPSLLYQITMLPLTMYIILQQTYYVQYMIYKVITIVRHIPLVLLLEYLCTNSHCCCRPPRSAHCLKSCSQDNQLQHKHMPLFACISNSSRWANHECTSCISECSKRECALTGW